MLLRRIETVERRGRPYLDQDDGLAVNLYGAKQTDRRSEAYLDSWERIPI